MTVKMASDELVDLLLALGVQVLELVEVAGDVEPVGGDDVRLPLDQVLGLDPGDLGDRGEGVGQVRGRPLYAIPVEGKHVASHKNANPTPL